MWKRYEDRGLYNMVLSRENMEAIQLWAECLDEERRIVERITDEHLDAQLAQIQHARQITRVSPTAIYRYALESVSNTGFQRHREFIANVRAYRDVFWNYIKSEDQKDRDSLHAYFVQEGMSDKPASFDSAPRFAENLSLAGALDNALLDIAVLILFGIFLFMAAYVSFIKADVR